MNPKWKNEMMGKGWFEKKKSMPVNKATFYVYKKKPHPSAVRMRMPNLMENAANDENDIQMRYLPQQRNALFKNK